MLNQIQGQDEGVRYLRRVVEGRYTSPLLLVGQEGVGRKFSVLEAAKEAFSRGDETDSFHRVQIDQGTHPDLNFLCQEDGKEIGVDAIRSVIEESYSFPMHAPARYILIDGADHLSTAAANALLKTLEEPPKSVRFFLLAESANGVLPTIRSRCGFVRYRSLPEAFILAQIQRFESDAAKALVYARLAEGSVGRAVGYWGSGRLRLRDQVLALLKIDPSQDLSALFTAVDAVGADLPLGVRFLEHALHDLVMVTHDPSRLTNVDVADEIRVMAEKLGPSRITRLVQGLRRVQGYLARNTKIQLPFHVKSLLVGVGS